METLHPAQPTGSGQTLIEQLGIALPAAPIVLTDGLSERLAAALRAIG
jgi:hypothetical protein